MFVLWPQNRDFLLPGSQVILVGTELKFLLEKAGAEKQWPCERLVLQYSKDHFLPNAVLLK